MLYIKLSGLPLGWMAARFFPLCDWKICVLVGLLLTTLIDIISTRLYYYRKARQLGTKPARVRPTRLPFGIDMVKRALKADRENRVPEHFQEVMYEVCPDNNYTFIQSLFGSAGFFTAEPKNIQAILATQFNDFSLGSLRKANFDPLLGTGIFTANGKSWEHFRGMLRPQFTRDQVSDLELEEAHVQDLFKHLAVNENGWTANVNLSPLFFRLTLDSATEFLFGQSVQSQIAALPDGSIDKLNFVKRGGLEWDKMAACFDEATHGLGHRARYGELYWLYSPKKFFDDCKEVHRFCDYYVNLALTEDLYSMKELAREGKKPKYIFLAELVKSTRNPKELRDQLLHILLAGRDTTAGLLGWTFWLLARHPEQFEKLRRIVLDDFGTHNHPKDISFATLKSCQHLQYTMNETLRLFPSVPFNGRRAEKDTTLPMGGGPDGRSPVFVRKDQEIGYSVYNMHRRKDLWGEDANEFKPERWIGRKSGWEYLPFNGGPRVCLGQQFALTEAGYVIVRILQRFDKIENLNPSNVPKHQYSVTSAPLSVDLRLHEARD